MTRTGHFTNGILSIFCRKPAKACLEIGYVEVLLLKRQMIHAPELFGQSGEVNGTI